MFLIYVIYFTLFNSHVGILDSFALQKLDTQASYISTPESVKLYKAQSKQLQQQKNNNSITNNKLRSISSSTNNKNNINIYNSTYPSPRRRYVCH